MVGVFLPLKVYAFYRSSLTLFMGNQNMDQPEVSEKNEEDECCGVGGSHQELSVRLENKVSYQNDGRPSVGCPMCGRKGRNVSAFTVSVFLKDPILYLHPERLRPTIYRLCETPDCPVVYYSEDGSLMAAKHQVRVRVWQKESDPKVPVCYCFRHTVDSIFREIMERGQTSVAQRISSEVKKGNCRCEVENPQGACCLGNVQKAIKMANQMVENGERMEIRGR